MPSEQSTKFLAVGIVSLVLGAALVGAGVVIADTTGGGGTPQLAAAQLDAGSAGGGDGTVTVATSGEAEAQPDKGVVRVSVEATADDPTVARRRVAENASAMRSALTDMGLNESAVRTTGFNIYEDRVPPRREGEQPGVQYRARHEFRIEVDDVDRVGEVIDTAVNNGATSVHGVQFTLAEETRETLRREAIQEAMTSARDQAETVAGSADLTLSDVRSARTGAIDRPGPVAYLAGGDGGGGTSIESGPVSVSATVTVVYDTAG